jgi:large subunit ribosomal protein L23
MSLLNAFKKKDDKEKPSDKKDKVVVKKEEKKKTEVKKEAVMTADGKLVATTKKSEEPKAKKSKAKKEETGDAYRVLMHPLVTEKGSFLSVTNQYVFAVAPETNKVEVRKAIRKVYGVDPIKVNIMNVAGKKVKYGKTQGRTKSWKKAIITLAAGQKIEIQEGL